MFSCLYHKYPDRFHDIFPIGETSRATMEHFWRGVIERRDARIKYHKMCGRDGWMRCAVPLCVHGDAVPCLFTGKADTKSFDVFSMQGLLFAGSTKNREALRLRDVRAQQSQGRRRKCACSVAGSFVVIGGRFMMGFGLLGNTRRGRVQGRHARAHQGKH